jgi:hypothetical protein
MLAAEVIQTTASFDKRIVERWLVEKMLSQFSFVLQQMQRSRCAKSTCWGRETSSSYENGGQKCQRRWSDAYPICLQSKQQRGLRL